MPEASDLQTLIVDFYTGKSVCCLNSGAVRKAAFFFPLLLVFFGFFFWFFFGFFFFFFFSDLTVLGVQQHFYHTLWKFPLKHEVTIREDLSFYHIRDDLKSL